MLRSTISVLDKEKDSLQETVDEKTERIACLDDNLANRVCPVEVLLCIPPGGYLKQLCFREIFCLDDKVCAEHISTMLGPSQCRVICQLNSTLIMNVNVFPEYSKKIKKHLFAFCMWRYLLRYKAPA